jgi:chromosome segregation ATPase
MKNLAILLILTAPLFAVGQETNNSTLASNTYSQDVKTVNHEAQKLEKSVSRKAKLITKLQQEDKETRRAIDKNEKQQKENVVQTARVKESMNGHVLDPLEDKIDRLEKDKRRLDSKTDQYANAIIRKKARIEKMLAEIERMEYQIIENDDSVVKIDENIDETQETITANSLVEKDKNLSDLEKDLKSLKKKNERQKNKLLRTQDQINGNTQELRNAKIELQDLNNQKALFESRGEVNTNTPSN